MKAENVLVRMFTHRMQTLQCQGDYYESEKDDLDLDEEEIILHLPDLDEDEEESSESELSDEEEDEDTQSHKQLEISFRQDSASIIKLLSKPAHMVDPDFEELAKIVNEDMSQWKTVCKHPDIVLYKKKVIYMTKYYRFLEVP